MMKKLKELYSSPNTTVLVVRFEEGLLQDSYHLGGGGSYGDGETNDNGDY